MLLSIALMLSVGMFTGWICKKVQIPSLLGMILTGIVLGPYVLNLIDGSILGISSDLRRIALIIILTRAGLSLDLEDLKKVGRPAILMCFVPACFEMAGMMLLAPRLLGVRVIDAAVMGAVVAAVSPAVIVPKMLKLMEEGYGTNQGIPQLILAGASVDDVFVIVMFSAFTGLAQGESVSPMSFVKIPFSIIIGIAVGVLCGFILAKYFEQIHIRDTAKVMILLSISFILVTVEDSYSSVIPFSGLIAVMCVGIALQKRRPIVADRLSLKFNKLWVAAEIILFVLVGATVDLKYVKSAGLAAIALILGVLVFRMAGVLVCMIKTPLNRKERFFCMMAYMPKATVQAAIGGVPLAMGLDCGNMVLTVAVLAILITAPVGAFLIEISYRKLLTTSISSSRASSRA
ncbi:MAG: cation:proton antiporter [Hespellia sp.]|nr:cation:proton antiporter [Hespellia sp.]